MRKRKKNLSKTIKKASLTTIASACLIIGLMIIFAVSFLVSKRQDYYKIEPRTSNIDTTKNTDIGEYDTVGWLRVQGTNIDCPIVFSEKENAEFPVQLESYAWLLDQKTGFNKKINIMGHNIFNLSPTPKIESDSFHRLEMLMAFIYSDFAKKNKYIQYTVDGQDYLYKIFSAGFVEVSEVITYPYLDNTEEEIDEQIKYYKKTSLYDYQVDVNKKDDLITVMTCTEFMGDGGKYDFQITGRRVRQGESIGDYRVKENKNYDDIKGKLKKGDDNNDESV